VGPYVGVLVLDEFEPPPLEEPPPPPDGGEGAGVVWTGVV
jgi:hypothetical protein